MGRGLDVLLADDSETITALARAYLEGTPHRLETVSNGKLAVDRLALRRYDVVLLDLEMPVMDGLAAVRLVRQRERELGTRPQRIVALTGHTSREEVERALAAGFSAHLAKPLRKADLLELLGDRAPSVWKLPEGVMPDFLAARRDDLVALEEAIAGEDYQTAERIGHTIAGTAGTLGLDDVTLIARDLERAALRRDLEGVRAATEELRRSLAAF